MTAKIVIQSERVALGTLDGPNGKPVLVYVTREWRRPLEQMAKLVNDQQAPIEALTARIEALES